MIPSEEDISYLMEQGSCREVAICALVRTDCDRLKALMWIRDSGLYIAEVDVGRVMEMLCCSRDMAIDALRKTGWDTSKARQFLRDSNVAIKRPLRLRRLGHHSRSSQKPNLADTGMADPDGGQGQVRQGRQDARDGRERESE